MCSHILLSIINHFFGENLLLTLETENIIEIQKENWGDLAVVM